MSVGAIETVTVPAAEYDALKRLYEEARRIVNAQPCHAHDVRPCALCLVGEEDERDLREAVEEVEVLR